MLVRGSIIRETGVENKQDDALEIESPLYPKLPNPAIRLKPLNESEQIDPNQKLSSMEFKIQFMTECGKNNEQTMKSSAYYIVAESNDLVVQRYSDKYKEIRCSDNMIDWKPNWSGLPAELAVTVRKPKNPDLKKNKPLDVSRVLDALVTKEVNKEAEPAEEGEENEEEEMAVDNDDDDDDNDDYTSNYFDNGENAGDEEEDTLDEPSTW